MYNLLQRFTALILLFSITLQSCYTPLKISNKKHSSTPKVFFNFGKSGKASTSNDSTSLEIVQADLDWLQYEDDIIDSRDNQDNEKQAIEYKKTECQESTVSSHISLEGYESQEEIPLISFYQKDGVWKAKVEEIFGSLQRSEKLDVVCSPGIDVKELNHIPKAQIKQLIHRIKHPKRDFIYLGKMGLLGGMMEEKEDDLYATLNHAVQEGNQEIAEKLIEELHDQDRLYSYIADNYGQEIVALLIKEDYTDIAQYLITHYSSLPNAKSDNAIETKENQDQINIPNFALKGAQVDDVCIASHGLNKSSWYVLDEKLIEAKEANPTSVSQAQMYYDNLLECKKFKNKDVARKCIAECKEASCFEELLILLASNNAIDYELLNLLYDDPQAWIDDLTFIQDENIFNHLSTLYTDKFQDKVRSKAEIQAFKERLKSVIKDRNYKKVLETAFTTSEDAKEQEKELIERLEKISSLDVITTGKNTIKQLLKYNSDYNADLARVCNLKETLKECSQPEEMLVKPDNIDHLLDSILTKDHQVFAQIRALQAKITQSQDKLEKMIFEQVDLQILHKTVIEQLININVYYTNYIENVCSSPAEKREVYLKPKILLQSDGIYRYLEEAEFNQIIGESWEDGDLKRDGNMDGGHAVRKYGGLFFKYKPEAPGIEFMVSKLLDRIYLTAATRLVNIKKESKSYPFLVSREVEGGDLHYFLEKQAAEFLPKLDPKNFACLFFLSLLTNPRDGRGDNYFVTIDRDAVSKQIIKYRIIGIDNDMSFIPEIDEGKVNVRSLLYFLPQMQDRIDPGFRKEFLGELVPEVVMLTWLDKLERENTRYEAMLEEGVFSKADYAEEDRGGMGLPIKLRKGLVSELYLKLCDIQKYMENDPDLTYQKLFEKVSPEVAEFYQEVKEQAGYEPSLAYVTIGKKLLECTSILLKHSSYPADFTQKVKEAIEEFKNLIKGKSILEILLEKLYGTSKMINVDSKAIATYISNAIEQDRRMQLLPLSYEKVDASLRKHYQNSFSEVKPWFDDSQAPLPIEKAQFQLLALKQKNNLKDSQQEDEKEEKESSQLSEYKKGTFNLETPIELADLFKTRVIKPGQPPQDVKKVLLVGEPGTGKTTVSHKLAYLWSQGQLDQSLQTVYVVPVRELQQAKYDNNGHFKREENLATAITNICFSSINKEKEYKELRASIELTLEQPSTLVVLDGLDEGYGASKNIISEVQQGKHKLLILSRPYGLEEVRKDIDLEVRHAGFTPEQLKTYVQGYFTDKEEKGSNLLQLIDNNQMLKNVLHVPVNACMVCAIWQSHEEQLRKYAQRGSLSELYEQMADYTWERYAEKMNQGKEFKEMLNNDDRDKLFHALGCIALAGLEKGEVLISTATVRAVLRNFTNKALVEYMLKPSGVLLFEEIGNMYQFPHLTFQEYFAGKELARRLFSNDSQDQKLGKAFLANHKYQSQYQVMLSFMAAEVSKKQGEEGIAQVLRMLQEGPKDVVGVHQLLLELRCLNEHLLLKLENLEALEKEFQCMEQFSNWIQQGLEEEHRYKDKTKLLYLLAITFEGMPAVVREAQNVLSTLLGATCDEDKYVRSATIFALGELVKVVPEHAPVILPELLRAAGDEDGYVRIAVIDVLEMLVEVAPGQVPEILPILVEAARNANKYICSGAIFALKELVQVAPGQSLAILPILLEAVRDANKDVCSVAIEALKELVKVAPDYIPVLLEALLSASSDVNSDVRSVAIEALKELVKVAPDYIPVLLEALLSASSDVNSDVRSVAIEALAKLIKVVPDHVPAILPELLRAAVDEDKDVRYWAIEGLGELVKVVPEHLPATLPDLLRAVSDKEVDIRYVAIRALEALVQVALGQAPKILPILLEAARNANKYICSGAIFALRELVKVVPEYSLATLPELLRAAGDEDEDVRYAAILALIELIKVVPEHVSSILPELLRAAGDEDEDVRSKAIRALKELVKVAPDYIRVVLEALLSASGDVNSDVRSVAIEALAELIKVVPEHVPAILPELLRAAGDEDEDVRSKAIRALKELVKVAPGYIRVVLEALLIASGDVNSDVRSKAIIALAELIKVVPEHVPAILLELLRRVVSEEVDIPYFAMRALGDLVKACPNQVPEVVPTLIGLAGDKNTYLGKGARLALEEISLRQFIHAYWISKNKALIPYILEHAYKIPLVVHNTKKGYQELVTYPTAGVPEVLGEYTIEEVQKFVQDIQVLKPEIDKEKEVKEIEKVIQQEKIKIVKRMLSKGLDINLIQELTSLSKQVIEDLAKE
jgi:HEAT repeat protein